MSLTVPTLANQAAAAKTFTSISKNENAGTWLNTTDSTSSLAIGLNIKHQPVGKTKAGIPIRRSLVQFTTSAPVTFVAGNGNSVTGTEEMVVNITITSPTMLSVLTATQRDDMVAFVRNLMTPAFVAQLARGEM